MTRSQLPIGIQDFRTIRSEGFHYVDKTPFIRRLVDEGRHYFLSRPCRFGKSLLLDTLRSLFEGHEPLFRGLDIHPHWDWSSPHPVVRLSFGGKYSEPGDVERSALNQLALVGHGAGLDTVPAAGTGPERLQNILHHLHHATGRRAVVLVDEYDKPILDALHDPELARANRDYLRGFYGIVKGSAEHVRFVFVTGVSMFSRASLFSGLNNLRDISLDPRYGTVCGYTEGDLDRVFATELAGLDRDGIRAWYNGYSWLGAERVYNPHDVLLLLDSRRFRSHWFETGSPTFLFRTLAEKSVSPMELEGRLADVSLVSKFDVDDIDPRALLFQTGYLTITDEERRGHRTLYRLDYPNLEVRLGLNDGLLAWLGSRDADPFDRGTELLALLGADDFAGFGDRLRVWLSGIPYQWHAWGDLARYEAWYASLLYMCLRSAGADPAVEESSSRGRADMVLRLNGRVFVLEFKVVDGEANASAALDAALAQMRERGYAERYRADSTPVHLVGVVCGREARNLLEVRAEPA